MWRIAVKLRRLSPSDWRDLFQAQSALIVAQALVWTRPRGKLVSRGATGEPAPGVCSDDPEIERLALALDRAARFGPVRPRCLVRAIALVRLMRSRGHRGALVRVGVRRDREQVVAHAWVEYAGAVVGEDARRVRGFDLLPDVDVAP